MAPSDFINTRKTASSSSSPTFLTTVDNYPYYPNLIVDVKDESTIRYAAAIIVNNIPKEQEGLDLLKVSVVSGGITNALFRVSGLAKLSSGDEDGSVDDVLVRVFGAEGMIDRDIETSTFAALASASIAPPYYGRFANGRIEGFLPNYSTLSTPQLSDPSKSTHIASSLAKLHCSFGVPDYLKEFHNASKPGMWDQLHSWLDQALSISKFKTPNDEERASNLQIQQFKDELEFLEKKVVPSDAAVAFCHNDLLAGNIMVSGDGNDEGKIQFVDFEYGGINYVSFDIANHFNEFAGGTEDGVPDYTLFPNEEQRREFVTAYIATARASDNKVNDKENGSEEEKILTEEEEIQMLLSEVDAFVMANHLYWGMWGVNQAAAEGCDDFDYLLYSKNRFGQYFVCKEEALKKMNN